MLTWEYPPRIVGGIARVVYEFSLILLVICRNTTEIARNTKKSSNEENK